MHTRLSYYLTVLLSVMTTLVIAQISPGELTTVHADLEGLLNCTKCHTLGDKVSNDKCLDCHKLLKTRIDAGKGYHVSTEVRGQDCFKCHSDHHGRNFDVIRFDTDRFDHELTGYTLTGAHEKLACAECHKSEFISNRELKQRKDTYLGLGTECLSCHDDYHQNTLSTTCTDCHSTDAFIPASVFLHDKTDFPLRGAHRDVDCAECHAITSVRGEKSQEFAGIAFANCSSCHEDVHNGSFGVNCKECHVEESFHAFRGMENFNHNKTKFPLLGKHQTIGCADCHDTHVGTGEKFKDFAHKDVSNCISCHDDVHQARFGTDCRSCHTEQSFQRIKDLAAFDHDLTDYELEGKHEQVDCKACHETKMTEPLPHNQCADCHDDYHEGQFATVSPTPDCAQCHTTDGFAGSSFTVEQHNAGKFALTGAHLATPCFACHLQEEKWVFRDIGERCIACHEDVHEGTIREEFYPDKACENCHVTDNWTAVSFDHVLTGFALEGAHQRTTCIACHKPDETDETIEPVHHVSFVGLMTECASCHENVHRNQFEQNGATDCTRCHSPEHWQPSNFDHNTARFVLEGAHEEVACAECHAETLEEGGAYVQYRLERFDCADCHSGRE